MGGFVQNNRTAVILQEQYPLEEVAIHATDAVIFIGEICYRAQ